MPNSIKDLARVVETMGMRLMPCKEMRKEAWQWVKFPFGLSKDPKLIRRLNT